MMGSFDSLLKRAYDKSKILFAVLWIIAYCLLMSVGDGLSAAAGIEKLFSLLIGLLLSAVLFVFLKKHGLLKTYGLCRSGVSARDMLYYIPLAALLTANLWFGISIHYSPAEAVLYILTMFCVGFLEELIFRGLLFNGMRQDNVTTAVIVSSVTFGIGHIINLINGSGAELVPNLLQVIYATAAGFMFVMIYLKTNSLIGCIVTHSLFNALSVFGADAPTLPLQMLSCLMLTVITGTYAVYITLTMRKTQNY